MTVTHVTLHRTLSVTGYVTVKSGESYVQSGWGVSVNASCLTIRPSKAETQMEGQRAACVPSGSVGCRITKHPPAALTIE